MNLTTSSLGNTNTAESDTRKFAFVARQFTYKSAECILSNRVPQDFPDLEVDDNVWFSLNIQKSNQIRQALSQTSMHGYASIDITLNNPDEVLERWYLIHLPLKNADTVPISQKGRKEVKIFTYRRYSAVLRSLYSLLGALPTSTLIRFLSQTPVTRRSIHSDISQFQPLPVKSQDDMKDFELGKIRFGPVITPIGKYIIILHHRVDIDPLIPRPIRTAPLELPNSSFTTKGSNRNSSPNIDLQKVASQNRFTISQISQSQDSNQVASDSYNSIKGSFNSYNNTGTINTWILSAREFNILPQPMTQPDPSSNAGSELGSLETFIENLNQMDKIELFTPLEPDAIKKEFQIIKSNFLSIQLN